MEYMRVVKNSDEIQGVFELPQQLKNRKVEIIIFPYSDSSEINIEEFGGILSNYRQEEKRALEKEAWSKAVLMRAVEEEEE